MDRRFIGFMILAFFILLANAWIMTVMQPPAPPEEQQVAQDEKPAAKDADAGDAADKKPAEAAEAEPPADDTPADENDAAEDPAEEGDEKPAVEPVNKKIEPQWATLGSVDPADDYKLLLTLSSRGGALERIELSEKAYRDLDDRSGYLGHLELGAPEKGAGALIRVVGQGTPANKAGLKIGDVITHLDGLPIAGPAGFKMAMLETKPGQEIKLGILRDGSPIEAVAKLSRKPLEIISPESTDDAPRDPLSLRVTLASVDGNEKPEDGELFNVPLLEGHWELIEQTSDHVAFRHKIPEADLEIIKHYRLEKAGGDPGFHLSLAIEVVNNGDETKTVAYQLEGPNGLPREGGWYAQKIGRQWGQVGLRDVVVALDRPDRDYVEKASVRCLDIVDGDQELWTLPLEYIGVDAQYFAAVLLPQDDDQQENWVATSKAIQVGPVPEEKRYRYLTNVSTQIISKPLTLAPGESVKHDYLMFAGPKKPEIVDSYGLDWLIYYGWFSPVSKLLLVVLHFFANYITFGNYGLAIVLLTVTVRLCMFPLSRKQVLGMQKMQELQPEMKKIQERYKTEPEKRMKAQQELFRKANYNPLSGCLPVLVQMPIFIGLYRALLSDVELRQAPLISENIRWASNLAAPDMALYWANFMPSIVVSTLGPYLNVLPLVTVALFLWQQKMFMPPPADEQQELQQKIMKFMMIIMAFFFFKVPSGLCIYFIASSLWGILERKLLPKVAHQTPATGPISVKSAGEANPAASRDASSNGSGTAKKRRKQNRR